MDTLLHILETTAPSYAPFILMLLIMAIVMYRAHVSTDAKFTLFDLIADEETGKGSLEKVGMLFAMLSITWWFIDGSVKGKIMMEDVIAYGGIMGLAKFADKWLNKKYGSTTADASEPEVK